jgi:hypothetical protein
MSMHTQSMQFQALGRLPKLGHDSHAVSNIAGRLIQIVLALYLMPVLLVVLMVGGAGLLVLAVGRLISAAGPIRYTAGSS